MTSGFGDYIAAQPPEGSIPLLSTVLRVTPANGKSMVLAQVESNAPVALVRSDFRTIFDMGNDAKRIGGGVAELKADIFYKDSSSTKPCALKRKSGKRHTMC